MTDTATCEKCHEPLHWKRVAQRSGTPLFAWAAKAKPPSVGLLCPVRNRDTRAFHVANGHSGLSSSAVTPTIGA